MAGTLTSSMIVRLVDNASAPARSIARSLLGIRDAANRAGQMSFGDRLASAMDRNNQALAMAQGRMLEAIGTIYALKTALSAPISAAIDFETLMEDIGQKANMSGEQLKGLADRIKEVARNTTQTAGSVAKSVDFLIGMGANENDAINMADPINKAATAYRASSLDLSKAAFAVSDNLKVPVEDVAKALDIMAQAGKEGGFELKDMAGEFPNITAAAAAMGMTGTKAVADLTAALEVARKGTASGAEAANNMANFMQKIVSKDTIKNMKKFGVDVPKELRRAAKAGASPIEHMLGVIDKVTNGGDAEKIAALFGDKQVVEFIRPMLANMKEYRRIRAEAMKAQGVVEADYERRLKTTGAQVERFKATMDNLAISVGSALLPSFIQIIDKLGAMATKFAEFADKNPELVAGITKATVAIVGFRAALAGLSFLGLIGRGSALAALSLGFNTIGRAAIGATKAAASAVALQRALGAMSGLKLGPIAAISTALRGMLFAIPGVAGLAGALSAVGSAIAAITAPVWLGIAAAVAVVAAAAALLWKYWDRVSAVVSGVASAIGDRLQPVLVALQPVLDQVKPVIAALGSAFQAMINPISAAWDKLSVFMSGISNFFSQELLSEADKGRIAQSAADVTNRIIDAFTALPGQLYEVGVNIIQSLLDGMVAKAAELLSWVQGLASRIASSIGVINLGGNVSVPGTVDSGTQAKAPNRAEAIAGAKAEGGPVQKGKTYLVGEQGMETFTPNRNGTIIPNGETMAALKAAGRISAPANTQSAPSVTASISMSLAGVNDPEQVAQIVMRRVNDELRAAMRAGHFDGA